MQGILSQGEKRYPRADNLICLCLSTKHCQVLASGLENFVRKPKVTGLMNRIECLCISKKKKKIFFKQESN